MNKYACKFFSACAEKYQRRRLLCQIYQLPVWLPFFISMDHGVDGDIHMHEDELLSWKKTGIYFTFNYQKYLKYKFFSPKLKIYCIEDPYLTRIKHLSAMNGNHGALEVYFHSHSTKRVRDSIPITDHLQALNSDTNKILNRVKPIVCLAYYDYQSHLRKAFEDAGYVVITAGDPVAIDFPDRLFSIILSARRISSNGIGSHIAYAAAAGKVIIRIGLTPLYVTDSVSISADLQQDSPLNSFFWGQNNLPTENNIFGPYIEERKQIKIVLSSIILFPFRYIRGKYL